MKTPCTENSEKVDGVLDREDVKSQTIVRCYPT